MKEEPENREPEEVHAEDGTELGAIRIHQNVIAAIARRAAVGIPGVVALSSGIVDGLAGRLVGKGTERGIRVDLQEDGVRIEVAAVFQYGVRIPQVAWGIQSEVKKAVQEMTGKNVISVDVVVQGIEPPADAEADAAGSASSEPEEGKEAGD